SPLIFPHKHRRVLSLSRVTFLFVVVNSKAPPVFGILVSAFLSSQIHSPSFRTVVVPVFYSIQITSVP
ncbi:BgTH12-02357, partial [Blumeria graminis f. sp. triticale]